MESSNRIDHDTAEELKSTLRMRLNSMIDFQKKTAVNAIAMDQYVSDLDNIGKSIILMKFVKGLRVEYIAQKLHISRATLFRKQERALREIALMQREKKVKT